jgi:thioredoxin 1
MDGMEEKKRAGGMGVGAKIGIVAVLIVIVAVAIFAKNGKPESGKPQAQAATPAAQQPAAPAPIEPAKTALPKLVDLGADKCIPCKMMAPILEDLKKEYAGKLDVVFIDVWKNEDAGKQYGVQMIPTQIFFDAAGKEIFRHQGFFAKEDILAKWKDLGINLAEVKN